MAGFGKNPRHGKRPSTSSSSSCFSTAALVVFIAFCILGLWMLTSSSIIPSQTTTTHLSRAAVSSSKPPPSGFLRDSPPSLEDTQSDLPDDTINGDGEQATVEGEEKPGSKLSVAQRDDSTGAEEDNQSESGNGESAENQQQQNEEGVEGRRSGEETQKGQMGRNEESQEEQHQQPFQENREEGEGVNAVDQQQSDQNADGGNNEEENKLQSEEQQQSESKSNEEHQNSQGEQQETENDGQDNQQEQQHQKMGTDGEENQQETQQQQQQVGNDVGENQQESQQQQIESNGWENQKVTNQQQKETNNWENQGETQEQRMHSNDWETQQQQGTESGSDVIQQQSQTEVDEDHDQIQQQIDEITSGSQQQSEEGGNDGQLQPEQQTDTKGSTEDHQQPLNPYRRQIENGNPSDTSEVGHQQGDEKFIDPNANDSLPDGGQSEVTNERDGKKRPWMTQADQSENEKERRKGQESHSGVAGSGSNIGNIYGHEYELCNVTAGVDYIPCLDNVKAIKQLHSFKHFEHRERHCPEESPTCLVPLPEGYRRPIEWPKSRDKIWYNNVPRTKLAEVKGHQNWVKVMGQYLTFPGGGTQFIHGALHYIDFIQQSVPNIAWGKHTRVILDVGCGVASFGGYLFERDVLAMSLAPKDEHEAQVQFALERGIPAISAVMGSQRLPFPSRVFDIVHCARCRVPWHADGGTLLLELNRVLRPGGFFVWSATPVYQKLKEDVEIWKAMKSLAISMCWDIFTIKKDRLNSVGAAFFRKPISNECYDNRKHHSPPMCKEDDDPNAAWYIPLKPCMHRVPVDASERGSQWPEEWPRRVQVPPYWLNSSQIGVYGKSAPDDFTSDYEHWKRVVMKSYLNGLGINWSKVRNVMDMRAVYGGFAAALKDLKVWVMNVVNTDSPDTLPIIYERGLFGIYHDWCESFSTYPRTYDLLHADHLFSRLKKRCKIVPVMAEVDRIVRPGGKLIVRDDSGTVSEVETLLKSLHWVVRLTFSKDQEGILHAEKSDWRPEKFSDSS